jgi:sulfate adenylyltransferase subunit 1
MSALLFNHNAELLRFATAGSVDDGKSTLIGRLLVDCKGVFEDQLQSVQNYHERKGGKGVDLALLTDGLQAEREQGITIDVAYRYFATPQRKFIIADTPGHEQYTRNMVTGASTAALTIVLIDARKGLLTQSRRHAYIAHLLQIPHVIIAINKMDLVNYSQTVYEQIRTDFLTFAENLHIPNLHFIPISALEGDMVVVRGDNMPWYQGETLLGTLETVSVDNDLPNKPFRFPVQLVNRPQSEDLHDFRGYMGKIESGEVRVNDEVTVLPSGFKTRIKEIITFDGSLEHAFAPQSVTLTLQDEIDIPRGEMLVASDAPAHVLREFEARLCWLDKASLQLHKKYLLKHTTNTVKALINELQYQVDINTLEHNTQVHELHMNEIGRVRIKVQQPLVFDTYIDNRATGSFILIDADTNNTVAAGMIQHPDLA